MSENGDKQEYKLVNAAGDELKSSNGYTGKGVATYTNGDIYDGPFKDGVSKIFHVSNARYRKEKAKTESTLITLTEPKEKRAKSKTPTKVSGKTTRSTVLANRSTLASVSTMVSGKRASVTVKE